MSADSRQAFALTGKDSGSPLLHWLAAGRPAQANDDLVHAAQRLGVDTPVPGDGFRDWYRALNRGYPFLDYSSDAALEADARLMSSYAAQGASPPPSTTRAKSRRSLSAGRLEAGGPRQQSSEELVAGWLRCAAGITRVRKLSHSTVAHRTSPSGGARHPTDIAVRIGHGWPPDLAGTWWYDPLEHGLVASDWSLPAPNPLHADDVVFAVTSHVTRAMWRYRDVRAFRPVLIDAGHVVETLLTVISSTGWGGCWLPAPGFVVVDDQLDPVLGYVVATSTAREIAMSAKSELFGRGRRNGRLVTNPLSSLTVSDMDVRAENHLRAGATLAVSPHMVDALAYATPSSRRDRPTTPGDVAAAIGIDPAALDALVEGGLLLPEAEGDRLWRLARPWFKHDWFLSLVVHAEEASAPAGARRSQPVSTVPSTGNLAAALHLRRTCRAFTGDPLPNMVVERALKSLTAPTVGVAAVVMLRHPSESLPVGTYVLEGTSWRPVSGLMATEDAVQAAAIGQPWAHGFALVVWLIPSPDGAPGSWEAALIECGRAAQRLALSVSDDPAIGVFQSPALADDLLDGILSRHTSDDGAYLVGVGVARDKPSASPPLLFSPADVFASPRGA